MQRGSPVLCEAVAGLLLLGILGSRPDLEQAASTALHDLEALGYAKIDASDPVRVYPLESGSTTEPNRASVWRPGTIALRPGPTGGEPAGFYLRHELMHEASYRSCHGSLPLWAEEAAAIAFAGRAPAGAAAAGTSARSAPGPAGG